MNSQKGKKSFYLMSSGGCAFFAALFFVKIIKNLTNVSITEIAIFFLLAICAGICTALYNDLRSTNKHRVNNNFVDEKS